MLRGTGASLKSSDFTQLRQNGHSTSSARKKIILIFTLIAPADKPKIVVAAVMEHARFGATWAGSPYCNCRKIHYWKL